MNAIEISNLSLRYLGRQLPAITVDELVIPEGQSVLITGKSGSGKSTLIQCINGVVPHIINAERKGEVKVLGQEVSKMRMPEISRLVGTLLQDPERQILNYKVEEEISFGPENLKLEKAEIRRRTAEAAKDVGIEHLMDKDTDSLSGGELQRVALTAILAMEPQILILDEPTSNIDPEGTERIFEFLERQKEHRTLILVEHKVERVLPFVDRIIVIDNGNIVLDVPKEKLLKNVDILLEAGIEIPEEYTYAKRLGLDSADIDLVRSELQEREISLSKKNRRSGGEVVLSVNLTVKISGNTIVDTDLKTMKGTIVTIMGKNGAGKSTLLKSIMGFIDDSNFSVTGKVMADDRDLTEDNLSRRGRHVSYLPQSFDLLLINPTVEREIGYSLKKLKSPDAKKITEKFLELFSLKDLRNTDPLTLSMGQRRRVAMASILSSGAKVILLDEPTSGQDFYHKEMLGKELRQLSESGYSFIVVTHDARFAYRYSDRIAIMDKGKIVLEGCPEEIFNISEEYGILPPSDHLLRLELVRSDLIG